MIYDSVCQRTTVIILYYGKLHFQCLTPRYTVTNSRDEQNEYYKLSIKYYNTLCIRRRRPYDIVFLSNYAGFRVRLVIIFICCTRF